MSNEEFLVFKPTRSEAVQAVNDHAKVLVAKGMQQKYGVYYRKMGSGYGVYVGKY